jgi:hypothetical protein
LSIPSTSWDKAWSCCNNLANLSFQFLSPWFSFFYAFTLCPCWTTTSFGP